MSPKCDILILFLLASVLSVLHHNLHKLVLLDIDSLGSRCVLIVDHRLNAMNLAPVLLMISEDFMNVIAQMETSTFLTHRRIVISFTVDLRREHL
jgi:hypothetical protein